MITDTGLALTGTIPATITQIADLAGSGSQALLLTANATATSPNAIDLGIARDIGEGQDVYARFLITEAVTGATSVTFDVIVSANGTTLASPTVISSTGAIAIANLTAGARFAINLSPMINSKGLQYLAVRYTVAGTATAGKFFADIGIEIQDTGAKSYASGFSVK